MHPASSGLATAFFRLYLLDTLSAGPARPASLLACVAAERLPFAAGAFGRALHALLDGGQLVPARDGQVALTARGAAERMVERERWSAVLPSVLRLLGDVAPRPAPVIAATGAPRHRAQVADAYQERVLVAYVRDRVASARDGGRPFCVALVAIAIDHPNEATRRAMVHRTIRASLGGATTLFGGEVTAFRYGDTGIALVAPCGSDPQREARLTTLARARIDELVRAMASTVRAFQGAQWQVRAGAATWTSEIGTTAALLRLAEDALGADGEATTAA